MWRPPYGYLPIPDRLEFERARKALEQEDWAQAERRLVALVEVHPDQLDLGFALQDLRRAQLEEGLFTPDWEATPVPIGPGEVGTLQASLSWEQQLALHYSSRLQAAPSVSNLVLAARAQADPAQALVWLDQALALDPSCAWAHYGRAHALLGLRDQYRWGNAREALDQALTLDPSHLHARRMEAWMLAQEGVAEPASIALERWLIATEFDPRVEHESRVQARWIWLGFGSQADASNPPFGS